jgi:two-component system, LytTR family, sensor histidine kinase AlgZ
MPSIQDSSPLHAAPISRQDFLPHLCTPQAVFHLIMVGELLAVALSVADGIIETQAWHRFGMTSLLVQWIVLSSAAALCPLRAWFRERTPEVAGCVSYALVLSVTAAISAMASCIQQQGNWPRWETVLGNTLIAAVFAGVVLRYFYLQQQLRNQQQSELEARIQALQSRIRPHFLFNSMNSIASLIAIDPERAELMVEDLSDLFRASLSEPGLVSLEQEIALCERFSRIESLRLGDRLQVQWHKQGSFKTVQIPSLLLQPLLENAIYHGIQPLPAGGIVDVDVHVMAGAVRLAVSNPIPPESASRLKPRGNGIALDNMRHRLEAYYGKKAQTVVVTEAGRYSVQIQFPTSPAKTPDKL